MPDLMDREIEAYEAMKDDLEKHHYGKWVVIKDGKLEGTYDSFLTATEEAIERFGNELYLIRQVGAKPISIPASVSYKLIHAES